METAHYELLVFQQYMRFDIKSRLSFVCWCVLETWSSLQLPVDKDERERSLRCVVDNRWFVTLLQAVMAKTDKEETASETDDKEQLPCLIRYFNVITCACAIVVVIGTVRLSNQSFSASLWLIHKTLASHHCLNYMSTTKAKKLQFYFWARLLQNLKKN